MEDIEMTAYEILKAEADKNLIDISIIFPVLGLITKSMRTYGMQEYMKGFEDGKKKPTTISVNFDM